MCLGRRRAGAFNFVVGEGGAVCQEKLRVMVGKREICDLVCVVGVRQSVKPCVESQDPL